MCKNSGGIILEMYTVWWRIIYNLLDITHQAHITGTWKLWISCHMCAYRNYIFIFEFFRAMWLCHTLIVYTETYHKETSDSWIFFLISGNSSILQLCCKSRANSKITTKKLCCVFTHNLTFENGNFQKKGSLSCL